MSMLLSLLYAFWTGCHTTMVCLFSLVGQKQQSVDQFLSRLPQSVIKDGKIIDVRSGIANVIKVCNSLYGVILMIENWNCQPCLKCKIDLKSCWLVNKVRAISTVYWISDIIVSSQEIGCKIHSGITTYA